jgi:hypothetical protein
MSSRQTTLDVYGPGTFTDIEFTPLPTECSRLLAYMARITPGFTKDIAMLSSVKFHGGDLPIIPGPIKAQAMVSRLQKIDKISLTPNLR